MSINDISTCLNGGKSCGVGREEDASNLLWCEHCAIALCFECDTNLHNSKNFKHGHLRVLLSASRAEAVRKCEHGGGGSCLATTVRLGGLISKAPPPKSKRKSSKKDSGRRSSSSSSSSASRKDGRDTVVGEEKSGTPVAASLATLPSPEKAPTSAMIRSALRGGYEGAGLGSRPVLSVTWHPDVKEPICSIASHTVGHKRAPAFLSRRSHQKQLRQKSKASSKSQKHAKKQECNKKKSEPVKARSDPNEKLEASAPTEEENPIDGMWSDNCTYCIQEESLCDCVNMSDDPYLQSVLLESIVRPENITDKTAQDAKTVKTDERIPEDYRQLLASMFHAATSIGKGVEMHAPSSGSQQAFKQATQGKFSPLISVV